MEPNKIDAIAQLIHAQFHRLGTGRSCGKCQRLALAIANLLERS